MTAPLTKTSLWKPPKSGRICPLLELLFPLVSSSLILGWERASCSSTHQWLPMGDAAPVQAVLLGALILPAIKMTQQEGENAVAFVAK